VYRPRRVGADELDLNACTGAKVACAVSGAGLDNRVYLMLQPLFADVEVDETGWRRHDLANEVAGFYVAGDRPGQVDRRPRATERLLQPKRQARRIIAVFRALRSLDDYFGQRDGGDLSSPLGGRRGRAHQFGDLVSYHLGTSGFIL
jgi:hypothetical protein